MAERRNVFPVLLLVEFQVTVYRGRIFAMRSDENRGFCKYLFQGFPTIHQHITRGGTHENFNAASAIFHIKGVNVHPGEAKDIMVNAALVGCEIVSRLPEAETPAHTSGREGFYHLTDMSGDVASATLSFIIRDHDKTTFEKRLQNLRDVAQSMNQKYGPETVTLDIEHSYENMISVIEDKMEIVDLAKQAIASEGLTPLSRPIRGGTDGARLSFMGLPCPNLGTGGYGFHGPYEHISVEGMQTAVRILKNIATHPIRK